MEINLNIVQTQRINKTFDVKDDNIKVFAFWEGPNYARNMDRGLVVFDSVDYDTVDLCEQGKQFAEWLEIEADGEFIRGFKEVLLKD